MSLITLLSRDEIILVLQYVDFDSLVRLFATCDIRLQKIMSSTGAIHHLSIAANSLLPQAPIKYFLNHVKSPRHAEFAQDVIWPMQSLPLLTSIAPRSLTLHHGFLDESVHDILQDYETGSRPDLKAVAELVHPDGLVNFSLVAPSLESLTINGDVFRMPSIPSPGDKLLDRFVLTLPSTLTHLSLSTSSEDLQPSDWVPQLPQSLVSLFLCLDSHISLSALFDRLPRIETLRLKVSAALFADPTSSNAIHIPKSLIDLGLASQSVAELGGMDLALSSIKVISLETKQMEKIDWSSLPPGLESFVVRGPLKMKGGNPPRNLTALEWRCVELPSDFNQMLTHLRALKSLKLFPMGTVDEFWKCFKLDLPSSLKFLTAPLQLSELVSIVDHHPKCRIDNLLGLDLNAPDVIQMIRSDPLLLACTDPVFDLPRLDDAMTAKWKNTIRFQSTVLATPQESANSWPSTKIVLTRKCFRGIGHLNVTFPHAEEASLLHYSPLLSLPPNLTKLDLNDAPQRSLTWRFPPTLTHLSSNGPGIFHQPLDPKRSSGPAGLKFKHLHVPRWQLHWSYALENSLQPEMEVLSIGQIDDMPDWRIPIFFSKFSAETLRNTSVHKIRYIVSGRMVAKFDGLIQHYTNETMTSYSLLVLNTELKRILASAPTIPALSSGDYARDTVIPMRPEVETVHLHRTLRWCPEAPSPTMDEDTGEMISLPHPHVLQAEKLREFVLQNSLLDSFEFPAYCSPSLVRIGLDARFMDDFAFAAFPQALEVLSLRATDVAYDTSVDSELPFHLQALPTSLKKLTLQSRGQWRISSTEPETSESSSGSSYHLTLVRFCSITAESFACALDILSLANSKVEIRESDSKSALKTFLSKHTNITIASEYQKWTHLD